MKQNYHPITELEIHDIQALTYEHPGVKDAVSLVLSKPEYKGVIPSTWNPDGKGILKGSTSYSKPILLDHLREITTDTSISPLTQAYSERALRNALELSKNSKHPGLVFYDNDSKRLVLVRVILDKANETYENTMSFSVYPKIGANEKLHKNINGQVKSDSKYRDDVDFDIPFVVGGLIGFEKDDEIEYGLKVVFNKDGLTEVYNVPVLVQGDGSFSSEDLGLIEDGFPTQLGNGNRNQYTAKDGVRRFDRDRYLVLYARYDYLAGSYDTGRVHVVKKISSGNLAEIISYLEESEIKQILALQKSLEGKLQPIRNFKV